MYNRRLGSHHTPMETSSMNALGTHLLQELRNCNPQLLDDLEYIRQVLTVAAKGAGATIVGESFHQFDPRGVTGIIAIAESHLCIHTWPDHKYAAVDIFTCGENFKPYEAAQVIIQKLQCDSPSITELQRGLISKKAASSA